MVSDDQLQPVAAVGFDDMQEVLSHPLRIDEGGLGIEVLKAGKIMVIADVTQDPTWLGRPALKESEMILLQFPRDLSFVLSIRIRSTRL